MKSVFFAIIFLLYGWTHVSGCDFDPNAKVSDVILDDIVHKLNLSTGFFNSFFHTCEIQNNAIDPSHRANPHLHNQVQAVSWMPSLGGIWTATKTFVVLHTPSHVKTVFSSIGSGFSYVGNKVSSAVTWVGSKFSGANRAITPSAPELLDDAVSVASGKLTKAASGVASEAAKMSGFWARKAHYMYKHPEVPASIGLGGLSLLQMSGFRDDLTQHISATYANSGYGNSTLQCVANLAAEKGWEWLKKKAYFYLYKKNNLHIAMPQALSGQAYAIDTYRCNKDNAVLHCNSTALTPISFDAIGCSDGWWWKMTIMVVAGVGGPGGLAIVCLIRCGLLCNNTDMFDRKDRDKDKDDSKV